MFFAITLSNALPPNRWLPPDPKWQLQFSAPTQSYIVGVLRNYSTNASSTVAHLILFHYDGEVKGYVLYPFQSITTTTTTNGITYSDIPAVLSGNYPFFRVSYGKNSPLMYLLECGEKDDQSGGGVLVLVIVSVALLIILVVVSCALLGYWHYYSNPNQWFGGGGRTSTLDRSRKAKGDETEAETETVKQHQKKGEETGNATVPTVTTTTTTTTP